MHTHRCLHRRVPCVGTHTLTFVHTLTHTPASAENKHGGTRATHTHPVTPYTYTLHTHNTHTHLTRTPLHAASAPSSHSLAQRTTPACAHLHARTQAPTPAHARACAHPHSQSAGAALHRDARGLTLPLGHTHHVRSGPRGAVPMLQTQAAIFQTARPLINPSVFILHTNWLTSASLPLPTQ